MATKAYITPNVLKWARESARVTEEIAAAKVSVSVDKLIEWENGENQPANKNHFSSIAFNHLVFIC